MEELSFSRASQILGCSDSHVRTLQTVTGIRQKLNAIFIENADLDRLGCTPVSNIILAAADKAATPNATSPAEECLASRVIESSYLP